MSPGGGVDEILDVGFPRVSGDEPNLVETQDVRGPFSPRERG